MDARLNDEGDVASGLPMAQVIGDFPGHTTQVDRLILQVAAAQGREQEDVVDELGHPLAARPDPLQEVPALVVQTTRVAGEQFLAKAVDGPERGTQIVRDRVAERLQFLVRRFQLGRPLADAGLEFRVHPPEFLLGFLLLRHVLDGQQDHGGVVVLVVDPASVEQHGPAADPGDVVVHCEVTERLACSVHFVQQLAKRGDVQLAGPQLVEWPPLSLLRG